MLKFEDVFNNEEIKTYIKKADEALSQMGFTEHSFAHVKSVADKAKGILETLGYSKREAELAQIAAYLHDIGNVINRNNHALSGAVLAFNLLQKMNADPEDIASIVTAIGNHDEGTADAVTPIAAALILSDKTDVRRSRVRNQDLATFDIHDRVNYSVTSAKAEVSEDKTSFVLDLTIDTEFCSVMDYFEIFLTRMILCRKAAERLSLKFRIIINGQWIL